MRSALIIGTEVATNGLESGASIRVDSIKNLLTKNGYHVDITSRRHTRNALASDWDLVVFVSFSTSKYLRLARKKAKTIWFDPTDSWSQTRISLFRKGDVKQILLLIRDLFWIWTAPNIDLITFITRRDSIKEQAWWKHRSSPLILPVQGLDREVKFGNEPRLVFIGDGSYGPNKDALTFLSQILKYLPSTLNIHVFGSGVSDPNPKFIIHGYVPQSELYTACDIHLAPITLGGGLKLKVAIPLWNGLHVVSTQEAAVGFKDSDRLEIANSPREFGSAITRLLGLKFSDHPFKPSSEIYLDDQTSIVDEWLARLSIKE